MKTVIDALRDWLAQNDHPSVRYNGGGFKLQVVFPHDSFAFDARNDLLRELSGQDYHFAVDKDAVKVLGAPVEFHGPLLKIER